MRIDVEHLETGPGGPASLLVRAHGRVGEAGGHRVVVRLEGRAYAVVPVEDELEDAGRADGPLVSAALVLPQAVVDALRDLGEVRAVAADPVAEDELPEPGQPDEERDRRPSAAELTRLAEQAGLD